MAPEVFVNLMVGQWKQGQDTVYLLTCSSWDTYQYNFGTLLADAGGHSLKEKEKKGFHERRSLTGSVVASACYCPS